MIPGAIASQLMRYRDERGDDCERIADFSRWLLGPALIKEGN